MKLNMNGKSNSNDDEKMEYLAPKGSIRKTAVIQVGKPLSNKNSNAVAENAVGFADSGSVFYFNHDQLDGTPRDNLARGEGIGNAALIEYITESLKSFGTDPHFGKCPFYSSGCGALLFPEELESFLPLDLYTRYFNAFNRTYGIRKTQEWRDTHLMEQNYQKQLEEQEQGCKEVEVEIKQSGEGLNNQNM